MNYFLLLNSYAVLLHYKRAPKFEKKTCKTTVPGISCWFFGAMQCTFKDDSRKNIRYKTGNLELQKSDINLQHFPVVKITFSQS